MHDDDEQEDVETDNDEGLDGSAGAGMRIIIDTNTGEVRSREDMDRRGERARKLAKREGKGNGD